MAKVASNYPVENFHRCNSWGKYQKHGQNPLPSSMEHFSEIYGTVHTLMNRSKDSRIHSLQVKYAISVRGRSLKIDRTDLDRGRFKSTRPRSTFRSKFGRNLTIFFSWNCPIFAGKFGDFTKNWKKVGFWSFFRPVGPKSTGRSVVKNRPRPTDFDRPRTLFYCHGFFAKISSN